MSGLRADLYCPYTTHNDWLVKKWYIQCISLNYEMIGLNIYRNSKLSTNRCRHFNLNQLVPHISAETLTSRRTEVLHAKYLKLCKLSRRQRSQKYSYGIIKCHSEST